MTRSAPIETWKRSLRLVALAGAGAIGMVSRFYAIPRWGVLIAVAFVPAVWAVTAFEVSKPGENETARRRRMRNAAIGLALFGLVAIFYVATMVRLAGQPG